MSKKKTSENRCWKCGVELTDENCRPSADSLSGFAALCVDCEQKVYDHYAQTQGKWCALFTACAAWNVPLKPLLLDGVDLDNDESGWITYINRLSESGQDTKNGKLLGFADGVTTLWGLFGNSLTEKDFAKRIQLEKDKIKKLIGTQKQRERWGTEMLYRSPNPKIPALVMTAEVYNELDRLYENRAQGLKGQTITPQIDFTLQEVAKNTLIYSYQRRYGERDADKTWKTIDAMLASENLRKKDEKPTEQFRMDALVDALEKAGLMENGDFLSYDELIEVLRDRFAKSKKYDYSFDVADQVILDVLNAMRANADLMQLSELPSEFAVVDEYGEFEPEETEEEKKRKEFAGLTKVQFENKNNEDKGEN